MNENMYCILQCSTTVLYKLQKEFEMIHMFSNNFITSTFGVRSHQHIKYQKEFLIIFGVTAKKDNQTDRQTNG